MTFLSGSRKITREKDDDDEDDGNEKKRRMDVHLKIPSRNSRQEKDFLSIHSPFF